MKPKAGQVVVPTNVLAEATIAVHVAAGRACIPCGPEDALSLRLGTYETIEKRMRGYSTLPDCPDLTKQMLQLSPYYVTADFLFDLSMRLTAEETLRW